MDNELLPYLVGAPVLVAAAAAVLLGRRRRSDAPPQAGTEPTGDGAAPPVVTAPEAPAPVDGAAAPTAGPDDLVVPDDLAAPPLETPEPTAGRLRRLRERLARSGSPLGTRLLGVLSRDHLTEDDWDELEETLLLADVGAGPTDELIDALRTRVRVDGLRDGEQARAVLREQLLALVDPSLDRTLATEPTTAEDGQRLPAVVLVVGVNGTGKTTTVGKLARVLVADGRRVVLGAADTFRAAAADQLQTWGSRVGVPTVRSDRDGADPAAVAFDAVRTGVADGADVVLVDTAGRLQNKAGLMDELGKITRVITRTAPLSEVLLVLDATTGQNGLNQARVFGEVAGVTGIVLTKLDGTAKGGIVVAVQRELGVPVKLVGLGEGPDDLAPFDPEAFVDGLLQT
ncbi:signal recognition particle-docking protein FtsY [Cellulomonas flavigena DSM 20109]|uniref:Signal recognition particle receptor FtsY n=1 Tax=Cellulomonas flavigena (strain ATCC 482 / DSM 20109 / BCRC 11376 / JCM 18109 / NBRC 3775 / NCIMB 8073 / NRS 134) TaxID=446466 RepID=D5UD25_CELFN|nr:signal recognition particle-docking protein FtsY [Cellulomonas flavigena]ADG74362.1 signal recognition particle-docking protein FtsY [Cellulomonas flavigena DSM 20109]